jgi:hypothetical protein
MADACVKTVSGPNAGLRNGRRGSFSVCPRKAVIEFSACSVRPNSVVFHMRLHMKRRRRLPIIDFLPSRHRIVSRQGASP